MYEKEKASASTLAIGNIEQKESYHKGDRQSSCLKEKIGCLLLCLLTERQGKDGWQVFDRLLRQYYAGGCR